MKVCVHVCDVLQIVDAYRTFGVSNDSTSIAVVLFDPSVEKVGLPCAFLFLFVVFFFLFCSIYLFFKDNVLHTFFSLLPFLLLLLTPTNVCCALFLFLCVSLCFSFLFSPFVFPFFHSFSFLCL